MDREDLLLKALFGIQNELYAIRVELQHLVEARSYEERRDALVHEAAQAVEEIDPDELEQHAARLRRNDGQAQD